MLTPVGASYIAYLNKVIDDNICYDDNKVDDELIVWIQNNGRDGNPYSYLNNYRISKLSKNLGVEIYLPVEYKIVFNRNSKIENLFKD